MSLEGQQLQNVARTVQQVVNEDQEIREIEEIIKKVSKSSYFDEAQKAKVLEWFSAAKEGFIGRMVDKGVDKLAKKINKKGAEWKKERDDAKAKVAKNTADKIKAKGGMGTSRM